MAGGARSAPADSALGLAPDGPERQIAAEIRRSFCGTRPLVRDRRSAAICPVTGAALLADLDVVRWSARRDARAKSWVPRSVIGCTQLPSINRPVLG